MFQLSDLEGLDQVAAADTVDSRKPEGDGEESEERLVKKVVELKVCELLF